MQDLGRRAAAWLAQGWIALLLLAATVAMAATAATAEASAAAAAAATETAAAHGARQAAGRSVVLAQEHVQVLRDQAGALTIAQAAAPGAGFAPLAASTLTRGYTRDVYWLRLTMPAFAAQGPRWLQVPPAILDDVRLYVPDGAGAWRERRAGDALPFALRGPYRVASFPLAPMPEGTVLYLRLATTSIMAAEPRLWDAAALRQAGDAESLGNGVYLGLMGAVILLGAIGWLTTRHWLHAVFTVFVAGTTVRWALLDGVVAQYLLPEAPSAPFTVTTALLGLIGVTGALCQMHLLQLRGNFPFVHRFYQASAVVAALVLATPVTGGGALLATVFFCMILAAPVLAVPAYVRLWRSGALASRLVAVVLPLYFLLMLPSNLGVVALAPFSLLAMQVAHLSELPMVLALHASIVLRGRDAERERNIAQRIAQDALSETRQERQTREEQAHFLAMLTHETRNPVALIDAAAHSLQLLDRHGAEPHLRDGRYANIRLAVGRMKLLMELAEVHGRLAHGERVASAARFDLRALTEQVVAALEPQAAQRVDIAGNCHAPLQGDARLLYFSLLNLLDNALKYADPGTRIEVAIAAEGKRVAWRIRDRGRGVPHDKAEAIFEKYSRLDVAANQPGLGLGLPLARQIVERHGGSLTLDRDWRDGAGFVIRLPLAA